MPLLRGLSKGDGKLVDEDGLRLPSKRGNMSKMKVWGFSAHCRCCAQHSAYVPMMRSLQFHVSCHGRDRHQFQPGSRSQAEVPTKQAAPAAPPATQGSTVRPPQGPVARGMMSQAEIDAIHAFMAQRVRTACLIVYRSVQHGRRPCGVPNTWKNIDMHSRAHAGQVQHCLAEQHGARSATIWAGTSPSDVARNSPSVWYVCIFHAHCVCRRSGTTASHPRHSRLCLQCCRQCIRAWLRTLTTRRIAAHSPCRPQSRCYAALWQTLNGMF